MSMAVLGGSGRHDLWRGRIGAGGRQRERVGRLRDLADELLQPGGLGRACPTMASHAAWHAAGPLSLRANVVRLDPWSGCARYPLQ